MTCAIIDDEPLAAELLKSYALKTPFIELKGTYNSAVEAMKDLRTSPVDLIFLDIQMPELSGIELATILPPETMIVFTTAFNQYAVESYKVNTIDYIIKPITYEAFLKAADKGLKKMVEKKALQESATQERFIYVKSDYKLIRLFLDDILYIEGVKDYVKFVLRNGQHTMCLMNIKTLDDKLPSPEFLRVHRSFIVHMPLADSIDRMRIVFGDTFIPVSDSYKEVTLQYISEHSLS